MHKVSKAVLALCIGAAMGAVGLPLLVAYVFWSIDATQMNDIGWTLLLAVTSPAGAILGALVGLAAFFDES